MLYSGELVESFWHKAISHSTSHHPNGYPKEGLTIHCMIASNYTLSVRETDVIGGNCILGAHHKEHEHWLYTSIAKCGK